MHGRMNGKKGVKFALEDCARQSSNQIGVYRLNNIVQKAASA